MPYFYSPKVTIKVTLKQANKNSSVTPRLPWSTTQPSEKEKAILAFMNKTLGSWCFSFTLVKLTFNV